MSRGIQISEAATIRNKAKQAARALRELLSEKALSATLRQSIEAVHEALKKTWADLEVDATIDPQQEALREARNIGAWVESSIHRDFTNMADSLYGEGVITREERIALSSAIGDALDAFIGKVQMSAPQLYARGPSQMVEGEETAKAELQTESIAELDGDYITLLERSIRKDGTTPIKIIAPGWGSSGYYPADVLERDGPKVFAQGVKMFWDHPTRSEEAERPERSLKDLAAELITDAAYLPAGPAGPGLYADAKVFEGYRGAVNELAPHIGVSIRALGKAEYGNADGRTGSIIKEISSARSVDFVTSPGAGGQVLSLFESARGAQRTNTITEQGGLQDMEKVQELQEANAQLEKELAESRAANARLSEMQLLREAGDYVALKLAETKLPDITRGRLLRDLSKNPPIVDGKIDKDAYSTAIAEAVTAETEYIKAIAGNRSPVTGMGASENTQSLEMLESALDAQLARLSKKE